MHFGYTGNVCRPGLPIALRDEERAWIDIECAYDQASVSDGKAQKDRPRSWVYSIALNYTQQTGLAGFSNSENQTRFERFLLALTTPHGLHLTQNQIKAQIRRFNFKNNSDYARDPDSGMATKQAAQ